MKSLQQSRQEKFLKYDRIAERTLLNYELGNDVVARLLNYSENVVYRVDSPHQRYILRIGKPAYHSREEIESELIWMDAIRQWSDIEIPNVVRSRNGCFIQKLVEEDTDDIFYCVLFTFLSGESLEERIQDLPNYFEELGEITAKLHNFNTSPPMQHLVLKRPVWNFDTTLGTMPNWGRWQDGLGITACRYELFQKTVSVIQTRLENFGENGENYGLIHADLRTVNLLAEGSKLRVIDFDDCGYSWYLYDLAASLSFIEHKDYVPELIDLWLKGYRKNRYLSSEEEAEIPTFIMLRRLLLLGWVGSHSDTETAQRMGLSFTERTEKMATSYLSIIS